MAFKKRIRKSKQSGSGLTKKETKQIKTLIKRSIPEKIYDTVVSSNQIVYQTMGTSASETYNFTDVPVFAATSGAATAGGRTSLKIHIKYVDFKSNILVPSTVSQFNMRVMLVRFPNSAGTDIVPSKIILNNVSTSPTNGATVSNIVDNCPYQILSDRTYTFTNSYAADTRHEFRWVKRFKKPLSVEYANANTSTVASTNKGLLRVYWWGDNAAASVLMNGYQNRIVFLDG